MAKRAVFVVGWLWAGLAAGPSGSADASGSAFSYRWEIAPEISAYKYEEPGVMTNEGTFYGVTGSFTLRRLRQNVLASPYEETASWSAFKIEGRLGAGTVDYDGAYMTGEPLTINGIDDHLLGVRFLYGTERQDANTAAGLYVGLAYRYLNNDSSFHPAGYERESNYFYIPLASQITFEVGSGWYVHLVGEFDLLVFGLQVSHLDDVDPMADDVTNWQWPGFGARGSVSLRYRSEDLDLALAPFVRYWWVDESLESQGYVEPRNNTIEYGLSFVVRF